LKWGGGAWSPVKFIGRGKGPCSGGHQIAQVRAGRSASIRRSGKAGRAAIAAKPQFQRVRDRGGGARPCFY